jgi:hypothetical protein
MLLFVVCCCVIMVVVLVVCFLYWWCGFVVWCVDICCIVNSVCLGTVENVCILCELYLLCGFKLLLKRYINMSTYLFF